MDAVVAVSGSCQPCARLKNALVGMDIPCEVHYLEAHPEWVQPFGLRGSLNIIVDSGELVWNN